MADRIETDLIVRALAENFDKLRGDINKLEKAEEELGRTTAEASERSAMGWTELNSIMQIGEQVFEQVKAVIDETVGAAEDYNRQVREMAASTGMTADETSRLIQVADDYLITSEEIRRAMEMAVKKGFQPGIAGLADLADKFVAMQDPTERAAMLSEIFGRNWSKIVPLMEKGGQAVRDQAAAVSEGLIATDAMVKASREYEIALDNLNDAILAEKLAIGNGLIPILAQLATTAKTTFDILSGATGGTKSGMLAQFSAQVQGMALLIQMLEEGKISFIDAARASQLLNSPLNDQVKTLADLRAEYDRQNRLLDANAKAAIEAARAAQYQTKIVKDATPTYVAEANAVKAGNYQRGLAIPMYADMVQVEKDAAIVADALTTVEEREALAKEAQTWAAEVQTRKLQELMTMQKNVEQASLDLAATEASVGKSIGEDLAGQLEAAGVKGDKLYRALGGIDEILSTNTLTAKRQEDAMAKLVEEYDKTGDIEAFKEGVRKLKEQFVPLNEEVIKAQDNVNRLNDQLNALNGKHISAYVDIYTNNFGGGGGGGGANNPGAGQNAPPPEYVPFQHGGSFMVGGPAGIDRTPVSFMATRGEKVTVTPVGQGAGPQTIINQYYNTRAAAALGQAMIRQKRAADRNANMGG